MGTTYRSTIQIRCWKEHTCACCGAVYSYEFVRSVTGQGGTAERASANANAIAEKKLATDADMQPCPTCGLYQPDMVGQRRAGKHTLVFWLALVAFAVIFFLEIAYAMQANTAIWAAVAACAVVALWQWQIDLANPNRDLSANKRLAEERVASGVLRHQPGGAAQAADEWARPGKSFSHMMALLLLLAAVALAATPELLRSTRKWPLNEACYPPVIGPGDQTRIYMQDKISSIKSYWRGSPRVVVREAGASGQPRTILATTNQNTWGDTIHAKSSEKHSSSTPWVNVSLPEEAALADKDLACDIELNVEYPEASASSSYEVVSRSMRRNLTLHTAPAGAGGVYNGWWWKGTVAAMGLALVCSLVLRGSAKGLRKWAQPTRVYT